MFLNWRKWVHGMTLPKHSPFPQSTSIWPSSKPAPRLEVTDGIPQISSEYRAGPKGKGYANGFISECEAPFD